MSALKTCPKCWASKPHGDFHRAKARLDGYQVYCKTCKLSMAAESRLRHPDPEALKRADRERVQRYRDADPGLAARKMREWRAQNKERCREIANRSARKRLKLVGGQLNAVRREKWANDPSYKSRIETLKKHYYQSNRQVVLQKQKQYGAANAEKRSLSNAIWREANRERKLSVNREHYRQNAHRWRAYSANRKATKLLATPKWADAAKIAAFYANTPEGMQVDHIVPLQGKQVCGLHWEGNFQYLPALANQSKRNFFNPEKWAEQGRLACQL